MLLPSKALEYNNTNTTYPRRSVVDTHYVSDFSWFDGFN
jgi:hypothetical protein